MDLGVASASPSLNGYGASSDGEMDVLVLIGAAFVGGLLLGVLVRRLVS
jgi:hypothetical protein